MPSSTMIFFVISSFVMITYGRTLNSPDQFMPLIFSSVNPDGNAFLPPPTGQNRLIVVIEQIIKYISSIKSSETFVDNIVSRQKDVGEKIKILTFLNKCFEITHNIIQREIDHILGVPEAVKKSSNPSSSAFTLEELQQAQNKVNDLLNSIEKRLATLKTWIPPTMPFLGFF